MSILSALLLSVLAACVTLVFITGEHNYEVQKRFRSEVNGNIYTERFQAETKKNSRLSKQLITSAAVGLVVFALFSYFYEIS